MGSLIAFILMIVAGVTSVTGLVLVFTDSMFTTPRRQRFTKTLLLIAILSFLGSWAVVRIVEAGLW